MLLGSSVALGIFIHTHPDWTFLQLVKFIVVFIVVLFLGLFLNAAILFPLLYNLPKSLYHYFTGRLRIVGILWQFIVPVSCIFGLAIFGFIDGYMGTSALAYLTNSMGVNLGLSLSFIVILLTFITPNGLSDLRTGYEKNTLARFGKVGEITSSEWVQLCRDAAEQGDAEAQCFLAMRHATGDGVSQDFVEAYLWAKLANEQGYERASETLAAVGAALTPEQIMDEAHHSSIAASTSLSGSSLMPFARVAAIMVSCSVLGRVPILLAR